MATLNNDDFTAIAGLIRNDAVVKAEFRSWNVARPTWMALFQAAENWFINAFNNTPATSFKAALDAVATTTANQAKFIGKIWFAWRIGINW